MTSEYVPFIKETFMDHRKEYSESMERVKMYFPDGEIPAFDTNKYGLIGKIGVQGWYPDSDRYSRRKPHGKWVNHLITDDLQIAEAGSRIIESRGWSVRIVEIDEDYLDSM